MRPGYATGRPGGGGQSSSGPAGQRDQVEDTTGRLFEVPATVAGTGTYGEVVRRPAPQSFPAWQRGPAPAPRPAPSIRTAETNAGSVWNDGADRVIVEMAATGTTFTADDFRVRLLVQPHHPNALGAALARAARRGVITAVGVETSRTPSRHGGLVRVWAGAR